MYFLMYFCMLYVQYRYFSQVATTFKYNISTFRFRCLCIYSQIEEHVASKLHIILLIISICNK